MRGFTGTTRYHQIHTCDEILDGAERCVHQKKPVKAASISSTRSRESNSRASSVATKSSSLSTDSFQLAIHSQISSTVSAHQGTTKVSSMDELATDGTSNAREDTLVEEIRGMKKSIMDLGILMKQSNVLLQQQQLTMEATQKVLERKTELLQLKLRLQMAMTDGYQKVFDEFENATTENKIHSV